jgi:hypothetical protein
LYYCAELLVFALIGINKLSQKRENNGRGENEKMMNTLRNNKKGKRQNWESEGE